MFELTPMAIAAIKQLHAWGVVGVAATLASITGQIAEQLDAVVLPTSPHPRGPHLQTASDDVEQLIAAVSSAMR